MESAVKRVIVGATTAGTAAACLAALLATAPAAQAVPEDTFVAAFDATQRAASTSGIDIVVISTSNRDRPLGGKSKGIPAKTTVRMHFEANPQGDTYTSVRVARSKKLLGAWGQNSGEGSWATLSSIYGEWPTAFARSRALRAETAITKLTDRMPTLSLHRTSLALALAQLVSPAADTPFADEINWEQRGVGELRNPDGSVVVTAQRGFGDAEAEDDCSYGPYRFVIKGGLIRSATWKRTCPDGEESTYAGAVSYESTVDGSTAPRQTESAAFALPSRPPLNTWQQLANAANATATTQFASVSVVNQRGMNDANAGVIRGLEFLDELMRYGNVGIPQQMGGPAAGESAYLIIAQLGQDYLLKTDLYEIDAISIIISADGIIKSISTVTGEPRDRYLSTFNR